MELIPINIDLKEDHPYNQRRQAWIQLLPAAGDTFRKRERNAAAFSRLINAGCRINITYTDSKYLFCTSYRGFRSRETNP